MQLHCIFYSGWPQTKQTIFPLQRTSIIKIRHYFLSRKTTFDVSSVQKDAAQSADLVYKCTIQNLGSAKYCDKSKRRREKINVGHWTQTITWGRVGHRFWLFLLCEGNACNTTGIVFRLVVMKVRLNHSIFLKVQMISSGPFLLP